MQRLCFVPGIHLVLAPSSSVVPSPSTRDFSEQFHTRDGHVHVFDVSIAYFDRSPPHAVRVIRTACDRDIACQMGLLACNMFNGWKFTYRSIPRRAEWRPAEIQASLPPSNQMPSSGV